MAFDHLILLIGTNPLPNYVVARFFLESDRPPKSIIVAHTSETYTIAQRLEKVLKRIYGDHRFKFTFCGRSDPGDAQKIRNEIDHYIFTPEKRQDKFHLNYTGGTKVMGIHSYFSAYLAVENDQITYSYLDAHDFTLKIEGAVPSKDLRKQIKIAFGDLFDLHDCKTGKPATDIDWSKANELITGWVKDKKITDFLQWRNKVISPVFYDSEHNPRKVSNLSLNSLQPDRQDLCDIHLQVLALLASLPEPQTWCTNSGGCLQIPETNNGYEEWFKGIRYLDGIWLEFYAYNVLKEKVKDLFAIKPNQHLIKGDAHRDFEIDMLLINGYQLCGISVTTANRMPLCKSKAFEILHRSTQMGGDEARSILISTMTANQVYELTQDLTIDTGDNGQLLILGIDDLEPSCLWHAIYHHITGE